MIICTNGIKWIQTASLQDAACPSCMACTCLYEYMEAVVHWEKAISACGLIQRGVPPVPKRKEGVSWCMSRSPTIFLRFTAWRWSEPNMKNTAEVSQVADLLGLCDNHSHVKSSRQSAPRDAAKQLRRRRRSLSDGQRHLRRPRTLACMNCNRGGHCLSAQGNLRTFTRWFKHYFEICWKDLESFSLVFHAFPETCCGTNLTTTGNWLTVTFVHAKLAGAKPIPHRLNVLQWGGKVNEPSCEVASLMWRICVLPLNYNGHLEVSVKTTSVQKIPLYNILHESQAALNEHMKLFFSSQFPKKLATGRNMQQAVKGVKGWLHGLAIVAQIAITCDILSRANMCLYTILYVWYHFVTSRFGESDIDFKLMHGYCFLVSEWVSVINCVLTIVSSARTAWTPILRIYVFV